MPTRRTFLSLMAVASAWQSLPARAQERFSPFVGSDPENVARMVRMAAPMAGETIIDLGSGDGRIVFAALRDNPGVRGIGVDINAGLVAKANEAANAQGMGDRARFLHQNVFDADLGKVDVIFMWLFPELMRLLRPKILAQARPGTRVVTATWDMGSWPADVVDDNKGSYSMIRMWYVPARIEGAWEWDVTIGDRSYRFEALLEQRMQQAEGAVRVGNRRELLHEMSLRGDALRFRINVTLAGLGHVRFSFTGRVLEGNRIEGSLEAQLPHNPEEEEAPDPLRMPWQARRAAGGGYFAPTGTNIS